MKKKGNKKLVFAKDLKQAALAVFVVLLFLGNTAYMIIKYFIDQVSINNAANSQATAMQKDPNATDETGMTETNGQPQTPGQPGAPGQPQTPGQPPTPTNPGAPQNASNNIYNQTLNSSGATPQPMASRPPGAAGMPPSTDDSVDILTRTPINKQKGKQVLISVGNSGRSNPFLPAGENYVPSKVPKMNLPAPPEYLKTNTDAGKVMTTTISGILYDKYSPSAIINIEGADYLVKRGDIINHYRILSISPNQVIVQLGKNIYQAGVGELLSITSLNQNTIANLNKKFGGNHHNNVSIGVKKGVRKRG